MPVIHATQVIERPIDEVFATVMGMIGRRNLRDTTQALQKFLESR
jgi:hypothetical protein